MSFVDRRRFLVLAASPLVASRLSIAQQQRVYKVASLRPTRRSEDIMATGLPDALRELGYVEGRNLAMVQVFGEGKVERMPALAREVVAQNPDVIVAIGSVSIRAAKAATSTIPIVFFGNFDPVALGYVQSLAQPRGHMTGVLIAPDGTLAGKKMELLTEVVGGRKRMGMLLPEDPDVARVQLPEARKAAAALGVQLDVVQLVNGDYASAFAKIAAGKPDSLFLAATTYFVRDRRAIIDLCTKHRLPAIYEWPEQVEDGGLMSYGSSSLKGAYARIAACVDRILKGANPGDIPVEQPTKLELVINAKSAKAIGLAIPQAVLLRADRVIE